MKLDLQLGETVQGDIELTDKNLMLVFQVNCPSCLTRALPLLSQIQQAHPGLNCFALSTAFEGFTLNNKKTTIALLESGELTQHSKRQFAQLGHQKLPYDIDVPVAMDWFMSAESLGAIAPSLIGALDEERLSQSAQQTLKNMLTQRVVPMAKMGRTFLNNDFQGTPTWVYFDKDLEIKESWFGHKDFEWIEMVLNK